jgi:UDP-glucose 4-epimerase
LKQDWPEARSYRHRQVLITGGLGFMGHNLAGSLLAGEARVRILDLGDPSQTGLWPSMLQQAKVFQGSIDDAEVAGRAVSGAEVIFNLAGKSGATQSNAEPLADLEVNVKGQLTFLEICRQINPAAKIVFPSSRLVYQPTQNLPVPETAPLGPRSIYGIHKLAGENYHLLYAQLYGMPATILRITNPYGAFQSPRQSSYGIINWFIHRACRGQSLPVYGDGGQLRDYVHIDDVVRAFLLCGLAGAADGRIFNVGGGQPVSFREMANLIVKLARAGRVEFRDWPAAAAQAESGDFCADINAIRQALGWRPRFSFADGLAKVIQQYKIFLEAESP